MLISERIFHIIEEKDMSQKDFALGTGIAQSTISDWKRKKTNPAADKIMVICDFLEVSPYMLLTGAEAQSGKKLDYVVVDKETDEYSLIETYGGLNMNNRKRLIKYAKRLAEED